jgi:hypothetical protein
VVLNSALANMPTATGWDGITMNKVQFPLDVAADNTAAITAMNALYNDPGNHYLNIHTTEFPGGAMRGQVQKAAITRLRTTAMPSNAVPPVRGLDAMAPALMDVATIRNADQTIGGALAFLAVNARFPGWVELMDINTRVGAVGTNGPWNLLLGYSFTADNAALVRTGFTNIVDLGAYNDSFSLGTIRDLLANPESQYLLIRTPDYGDTLRGQWSLSR